MEYIIKNRLWYCPQTDYKTDILGVCISVDSPKYYNKISDELSIPRMNNMFEEPCITLLKHGKKENVKEHYLTYVDSSLRGFCSFHYIELFPNEINCENINKIISTSCLPVKYLEKLIKDNVQDILI